MMAQKIREIMTSSPVTLAADRPVIAAAAAMKEYGIGDVIVVDGGQLRGIVTDRDLAVRVLADGRDPQTTTLGEVCSPSVVTVSPDDEVAEAVGLIRQKAVRRLPVVDGSGRYRLDRRPRDRAGRAVCAGRRFRGAAQHLRRARALRPPPTCCRGRGATL